MLVVKIVKGSVGQTDEHSRRLPHARTFSLEVKNIEKMPGTKYCALIVILQY